MIEMRGLRVNMEAFEIAGRPKIPYSELYTLRYRPIARTKDRLIESMELQEDLVWFGLIETASTLVNPTFAATGKLEKVDLARAYANIEDHRLVVRNTVMSAFGTASIRSWIFQDIDQLGLQEIRETGYLGQIWGSNFWVNDQLPDGVVYVLAQPKFLGWFPIRKDIEVIPANKRVAGPEVNAGRASQAKSPLQTDIVIGARQGRVDQVVLGGVVDVAGVHQ